MTETERRSFGAELELRGTDGRTVSGLVAPFNVPAQIHPPIGQPYAERFAPGAFTRTIAERGQRVKLLAQHRADVFPVGKAIELREDAHGLVGTFQLANTAQAEETRSLIADGIVDGFSIGFRPIRSEWSSDRRAVTRQEAALVEVSLTGMPTYDTARVESLRSDDELALVLTRSETLARIRALHHVTPPMARATALAQLRAHHERTLHR
jgi:hypothetical protein